MLNRILARVTGQDLRDQLARVIAGQERYTALLIRNSFRLKALERIVSELDTSTDELIEAVNDLLTAVDPAAQAELLQRISDLNAEIVTLQADDDADAAAIADLTSERDQALADAQENVGKQQEATARIRAVVPDADPVADPVGPDA